ncbi:MAG TPA: hypothetical protein VJ810_16230 [Blastocatellia bacterium]|nr:hypothetical protein [Blastocatellia bacterium]
MQVSLSAREAGVSIFSPRSGRQHKAQGGAEGATLGSGATHVKEPVKRAADPALSPTSWALSIQSLPTGAYAPGFMLGLTPQALC